MNFIKNLKNEKETLRFGQNLATILKLPSVIFLKGELGAGKTTLVRGFLQALEYKKPVKSPTYTLVETYELDNKKIYHFDLYRLKDPQELEFIGIRDYFNQSICFIEWPEKGENYLPKPDIVVHLDFKNSERILECESKTELGNKILQQLYPIK